MTTECLNVSFILTGWKDLLREVRLDFHVKGGRGGGHWGMEWPSVGEGEEGEY